MPTDYQLNFIDFAIRNDILQFGRFELKSGRQSPYFFNAGRFNRGGVLRELGGYYAEALLASGLDFDLLFGPAYKGIPLVTATAIALAERYDRDVPYAFNRKEAKGHGEGGTLVGAELTGKAFIVDDVITAGTAIREVMDLIRAGGGDVAGALVAIDRQERGETELSAIQEIERDYGIPVASVVKLDDIIAYIETRDEFRAELDAVKRYRETYGVAA